jgi:hypothetical protein
MLRGGAIGRRAIFPTIRFVNSDQYRDPVHDADWERRLRHDLLLQEVDRERLMRQGDVRLIP